MDEDYKLDISVIGLGKLGNQFHSIISNPIFPFNVKGFDKKLELPVKFSFLNFVFVDTPELDGEIDISNVLDVAGQFAENLNSFKILVISSTLSVGDSQRIINTIERISGRSVGTDFGFCINPVFVAQKSMEYDFKNPPLVLIGATDILTKERVNSVYSTITSNLPNVVSTNPYSAEILKLIHNTWCSLKISFVNEVFDLCSKTNNVYKNDVAEFFKKGGERSGKFMVPGGPFGGDCFPRDMRAFEKYFETRGEFPILKSINISNNKHIEKTKRSVTNAK